MKPTTEIADPIWKDIFDRDSAFRAGALEERAAVVAWLRSQVSQRVGEDDLAYDRAATTIERGEHRPEEKKP